MRIQTAVARNCDGDNHNAKNTMFAQHEARISSSIAAATVNKSAAAVPILSHLRMPANSQAARSMPARVEEDEPQGNVKFHIPSVIEVLPLDSCLFRRSVSNLSEADALSDADVQRQKLVASLKAAAAVLAAQPAPQALATAPPTLATKSGVYFQNKEVPNAIRSYRVSSTMSPMMRMKQPKALPRGKPLGMAPVLGHLRNHASMKRHPVGGKVHFKAPVKASNKTLSKPSLRGGIKKPIPLSPEERLFVEAASSLCKGSRSATAP